MIVQVALCSVGFKTSRQNGMHQLFGSGFPVAAGNGYKWYVELPAMVFG